jgi:hypothetical protein
MLPLQQRFLRLQQGSKGILDKCRVESYQPRDNKLLENQARSLVSRL